MTTPPAGESAGESAGALEMDPSTASALGSFDDPATPRGTEISEGSGAVDAPAETAPRVSGQAWPGRLAAPLRLPAIDRLTVVRAMRDVILPIVAIRLVIMVFAWIALAILRPDAMNEGQGIWNHWDGPHFLELAAGGYGPPTDPARIVLFPLYPASIALLELIFAPLDAAMLSSLIATLIAGLGLYTLVRLDGPARLARLSVISMVVFPTAYSLIAPYSEALFLAVTVWAFVAVRRDHMATAGILGALAAATRIQGAFLIPALGIEYLMVRKRIDRDVFWIFFVGAGLLVYLAINQIYFGSPTYFIQVQKDTFFVQNTLPWEAVSNLIKAANKGPASESWVTLYLAPLASMILLAVVTAWALLSKHSRPSYAIYTAISLVAFASLNWPISVPRYIMGVFPMFIAIGSWSRGAIGQALLTASIMLLAVFTALFVEGHWAF